MNRISFKITLYSLLGALLWTAHFMFIYAISEFGCVSGTEIYLSLIGVTLLVLIPAFYSVYKCWKLRRIFDKETYPTAHFMFSFGIINNTIFTFIITFQSLPIFYFRGECL